MTLSPLRGGLPSGAHLGGALLTVTRLRSLLPGTQGCCLLARCLVWFCHAPHSFYFPFFSGAPPQDFHLKLRLFTNIHLPLKLQFSPLHQTFTVLNQNSKALELAPFPVLPKDPTNTFRGATVYDSTLCPCPCPCSSPRTQAP